MSTEELALVALTVVFALGGVIRGLQQLGWLPAGSVTKAAHERAELAEAELRRAHIRIERADARIVELEGRTNLAPLIELVARVADGNERLLTRIEELNGGLKASADAHAETAIALRITGEAIKVLAGKSEMGASGDGA